MRIIDDTPPLPFAPARPVVLSSCGFGGRRQWTQRSPMPAPNSRASQLKQMIETARAAGLEVVGIEITPKRIYLVTKSVAVSVDEPPPVEPCDDAYARMKAELMR